MAAKVYTMVPTLERLDNFSEAFAGAYSAEFAKRFPNSPAGQYEQRAWREEWVADGRLLAVDLTHRTPEQQRERRHAAAAVGGILMAGNASVEIDEYPYADGRMARYVYDRKVGLVVVNDYPFPDGEVRPLDPEDIEALDGSVDTRGIYRGDVMTRTLTEEGQERLIADLAGLLAMDGYVQPVFADAIA